MKTINQSVKKSRHEMHSVSVLSLFVNLHFEVCDTRKIEIMPIVTHTHTPYKGNWTLDHPHHTLV